MIKVPIPIALAVVDSREQTPLKFDPTKLATTVKCLPVADYSLDGLETEIAIERKSLPDLVSSLSTERLRFTRELEKLAKYRFSRLLVEADISDVVNHHYRSRMYPSAILGSLFAVEVDLGIPVSWCYGHEYASMYCQGLLIRLAKKEAAHALKADSDE